MPLAPPAPADLVHRNDVLLVGRVAADPVEVELPSGDKLLTFRIIVDRTVRPSARKSARPGTSVDTLACAAWTLGVQRIVGRFRAGDVVQASGSVRRRFRRSEGGPTSVHEIELTAARRLKRAE